MSRDELLEELAAEYPAWSTGTLTGRGVINAYVFWLLGQCHSSLAVSRRSRSARFTPERIRRLSGCA